MTEIVSILRERVGLRMCQSKVLSDSIDGERKEGSSSATLLEHSVIETHHHTVMAITPACSTKAWTQLQEEIPWSETTSRRWSRIVEHC